MSTQSQRPAENEARATLPAQNDHDRAKPPALAGAVAPKKEQLSEAERQRLAQLSDRANAAHENAKQGALQFCRHSIEAGAALLEAHDLCPDKMWSAWLKDHFRGSARTAKRYMKQAKLMLLGGKGTDLSLCPSEELAWQFTAAVERLERRRATERALGEQAAPDVPASEPTKMLECAGNLTLQAAGASLMTVLDLFDQLIAALREVIESGQRIEYGTTVLAELEHIRDNVDSCRLLLRNAHALKTAPA